MVEKGLKEGDIFLDGGIPYIVRKVYPNGWYSSERFYGALPEETEVCEEESLPEETEVCEEDGSPKEAPVKRGRKKAK